MLPIATDETASKMNPHPHTLFLLNRTVKQVEQLMCRLIVLTLRYYSYFVYMCDSLVRLYIPIYTLS